VKVFNTHLHIIDFEFAITENVAIAPSYGVEDYLQATSALSIAGVRLSQALFKDLIKVI